MKANELLKAFPALPVSSVTERSDRADAQTVFVCVKGAKADGHAYAPDAYRRGCRLFVAEKKLNLPCDAYVCVVPDTRVALASLACRFFGNPSHRMKIIGITGTKGKTTVASLVQQLLEHSGIPCGYIGTNGIRYGKVEKATSNTTPDALTLQATLAEMENAGVRTVALEVSSQALMQHRADGTRMETVVFTNLSPDHIGINEHPDFEHYKQCKHRLFTDFEAKNAVFFADGAYASEMLADTCAENRLSCSLCDKSAFLYATPPQAVRNEEHIGIQSNVTEKSITVPLFLPLVGAFNLQNALLAMAAVMCCAPLSLSRLASLLQDAQVRGRSEWIPLPNGATVFFDYAHNGESMRQLLLSLRAYHPKRLLCLFGSVGERTRLRRRELGDAGASLCDLCILTSDNPGKESPEAILSDIALAFDGSDTPFLAIPDRAEAIRKALSLTQAGDFLVLAGKGHETYQLIGDKKIPFDEKEIVRQFVAARIPV